MRHPGRYNWDTVARQGQTHRSPDTHVTYFGRRAPARPAVRGGRSGVDKLLRDKDSTLGKKLCHSVLDLGEALTSEISPVNLSTRVQRVRQILERPSVALGYDRPSRRDRLPLIIATRVAARIPQDYEKEKRGVAARGVVQKYGGQPHRREENQLESVPKAWRRASRRPSLQ